MNDNFNLEIKEREDDEDEKEIKDFIKCPICMDIIKSPRMCLTCKKSLCFQCLKTFYNNGGKQCPICKTYYKFDQFIPFANFDCIQKFFIEHEKKKNIKKLISSSIIGSSNLKIKDKDINNLYDNELKSSSNFNLINNDSEICPEHHYKYIFLCLDCKKKLCGLCSSNLNSKKNKNKINVHKEHNVFKIKDIEKYNIQELFQSYKNISNKINLMNEKIQNISQNLNYILPYGDILKNQISLLSEKIKYNTSQLVKKVENIKTNISQKEKDSNEFSIGNNMKDIIRNKDLYGYKKLLDKIKNYSQKIKNKKSYDEENNFERTAKISYVVYKSEKIILYNIYENENETIKIEDNSIFLNNYKIFYIIEKLDINNIRFQVSFAINDKFKKNFIVSIIIKDPKNNKYQNINLFAKNENPDLFLFDAIYSSDKFYNLMNKEGNIEINIILSELKN